MFLLLFSRRIEVSHQLQLGFEMIKDKSLQQGAPGESYSKGLPFPHQYLLLALSLTQMGLREGQDLG